MDRNIWVEQANRLPMEKTKIEIVERKGIGHPDSIADGLAESVSRALCKLYMERYEKILHHNTDETQIVGGQSAPKFGGGTVLEPVYILLVGRATTQVDGERLPYRSRAIRAARDYLESFCPHLDVDMDVMLDCRIGQGSVDLRGLYETQRLLANDTSFGVGYAPFSETETITYETERLINGPLKKEIPEVGEDVKVMATRVDDDIDLTVAAAMVDRLVPDKSHYISVVEELKERLLEAALKQTERNVNVDINTGDNYDDGIFYLTVTGLSFENGDDGSVGRGNRANGLITPFRPMSMEATAGKNPVTHVGKLYNILTLKIANDIVKAGGGDILEAYVRIVSQIGKPIDDPQVASIQLVMADGAPLSGVQSEAEAVADEWLANISRITELVVNGEVSVF
ncbi:MAG: methionine adenosyltransferase [Thermoplasmata archaeon]|nr:methionine adenosyltransferase [Candidatus Thermoplasmatota archaeon]MCK4949570.1 methionine adenosyltransferase [Thermoplasmata archaeon]